MRQLFHEVIHLHFKSSELVAVEPRAVACAKNYSTLCNNMH